MIEKKDLMQKIKISLESITGVNDAKNCECLVHFENRSVLFYFNGQTYAGSNSRFMMSLLKGKAKTELKKHGYTKSKIKALNNKFDFENDKLDCEIYFISGVDRKMLNVEL